MPYTQVYDDQFARADSSTVGNGWVAQDAAWQIHSSTLEAQNTLAGSYPLNGCTRPASEASIEGKVRVFVSPITFARVGAVGRYDATGGGRGFGIITAAGNFYKFSSGNAGVGTDYQAWTATGLQLPTSFVFDFIVSQTNATTTTLTANFYASTDLNTIILSVSQVDTNAALQNYAGTFGGLGGVGYGAEIARMTTYSYAAGGVIVAGSGTFDPTSVTRTTVSVSSSPSTGGFGTLSYQWYRGIATGFTPASGTAVAGATGLTLADSRLTPGVTYFYKLRTTDQKAGGAQIADSNEVSLTTVKYRSAGGIIIGAIGDSITFGLQSSTQNGLDTEIAALKTAGYSVGRVNAGISGISVGGYAAGTAQFTSTLTAFQAAGVNVVQVMLGMNDCYGGATGTTKASYKTSLQSIVNALLAVGTGVEKVILNQEPYTYSNAGSSTITVTQANANLQLYQQGDAEIAAATTGVVMGDTTLFAYMQANPVLMSGQHPTQAGHDAMGAIWETAAAPMLTALTAVATSFSVTGPTSGIVAVASTAFTVTPAGGNYTGTITPSDGGAGGTFIPATLTWAGDMSAKTYTYTAASAGVKSIIGTGNPALTAPGAFSYTASIAPSFSVTGPTSGVVGVASSTFTVTPVGGNYTGTITPSDGGAGGAFSPATLTWAGDMSTRTFTYTSVGTGVKSITATANPVLIAPAAISYTASIAPPPPIAKANAFSLTGPISGIVGMASSTFTVTPVGGNYTGTITPSDGGAGGSFIPASLTWAGDMSAKTYTYTATSAGVKSITGIGNPALTAPTAISYSASIAPLLATAGVNAAGTLLTLTFIEAAFPPILPATAVAGFSLSGSHTLSVGVRASPITITYSVSPNVYSPEMLTVDYNMGTGNVTDSAAIPNVLGTITGAPVTNGSTLPAVMVPANLSLIEGNSIAVRNRDGSSLQRVRMSVGDTAPARRVQIVDGDGEPVDLSGCSATYTLLSISAYPAILAITGGATMDAPIAGFVSRNWQPGDTSTAGIYTEVWRVTDINGRTIATAPNSVIVEIR